MGTDPTGGGDDIVDTGGEGRLAGQAVTDRNGDVAGRDKTAGDAALFLASALAPAATVDKDDGGKRTGAARGAQNVEFLLLVVGTVSDVGEKLDPDRRSVGADEGGGKEGEEGAGKFFHWRWVRSREASFGWVGQ